MGISHEIWVNLLTKIRSNLLGKIPRTQDKERVHLKNQKNLTCHYSSQNDPLTGAVEVIPFRDGIVISKYNIIKL